MTSGFPLVPIKRLAACTLGKMLQSSDDGDDVLAPYLRAANVQPDGVLRIDDRKAMWFAQSELAQLTLLRGDVVVVEGGIGGFGRAAYLSEDLPNWGFQNSIIRLRPIARSDGRFLAYALLSARERGLIAAHCNIVSMPHFTVDKVVSFELPAPPPDEQGAIADFLDEQTSRIDTLIDKQTQLIATLRERRAAIADHVVWSGLDLTREMAPSGVDCARSAPAHWERTRAKALLVERDATSADGSEELLTVSHLTGITPRSQKNVNMIEAESHEGYRLVEAGDLVINTMWAWMGALGVSAYAGMVSPAYGVYAFRDRSNVAPEYFDGLFRSKQFVTEMTRYSRGVWTSRLRLYPESFLRLPIVVPPLNEQRQIASHVREHSERVDTLITKAEQHIALAKERRAALITASVTGQIDVRTAGRAA